MLNVALLSKAVMACTALVLLLSAGIVYFPDSYHQLSREDGVIESLGAVFFGAAAIIFFRTGLKSNHYISAEPLINRLPVLAWALLAFVAMGEEISWGQRIFGFVTPSEIQVTTYGSGDGLFTNVQNEVNLHNMAIIHETIGNWRLTLGLLLFIGVLYPLSRYIPGIKALYRRFCVPVCPPHYFPLAVGGYIINKFLQSFAAFPNDTSETYEMLLGLIFLAFALHCWRRPEDVFLGR